MGVNATLVRPQPTLPENSGWSSGASTLGGNILGQLRTDMQQPGSISVIWQGPAGLLWEAALSMRFLELERAVLETEAVCAAAMDRGCPHAAWWALQAMLLVTP